MGVVIPFKALKLATSTADAPSSAAALDSERLITDAIHAASDQLGVLAAARPLLDRCRDRYGFVVMRNGLPQNPLTLGRALIEFARGLAMVEAKLKTSRTYPTFCVYFGRLQLAWFEDGYSGTSALAIPNDIQATDLAAFVLPRVAGARSQSNH